MVRFSEPIHEKAFMATPVGCYFFLFLWIFPRKPLSKTNLIIMPNPFS